MTLAASTSAVCTTRCPAMVMGVAMPSTGIDPVSRVDLWRLVSEAAAAGAAVVISTTYLDEAERAAGLLVLDGGRTLAGGTLQDVLDSFDGAIARTATPDRRAWAWRRGRGASRVG